MSPRPIAILIVMGLSGCAYAPQALDAYAAAKADAIDAVAAAMDAKWRETLEWQCGRASIASYQRLARENAQLADRIDAVCAEYQARGWRPLPRPVQ